jgi:hypothetical protein
MNEIRSVNGFSLGSAWSVPVDMKWVLGKEIRMELLTMTELK